MSKFQLSTPQTANSVLSVTISSGLRPAQLVGFTTIHLLSAFASAAMASRKRATPRVALVNVELYKKEKHWHDTFYNKCRLWRTHFPNVSIVFVDGTGVLPSPTFLHRSHSFTTTLDRQTPPLLTVLPPRLPLSWKQKSVIMGAYPYPPAVLYT